MSRAVYVRVKLDTIVTQLAKRVQTEDLKSAAVRQDRTLPGHESVQAAELIDGNVTGPQIEMIGVAENDRRAGLFEHLLREGLDRSLGAYGHEHRRVNHAVRRGDASHPGGSSGVGSDPFECDLVVHCSSDLANVVGGSQAGSRVVVYRSIVTETKEPRLPMWLVQQDTYSGQV